MRNSAAIFPVPRVKKLSICFNEDDILGAADLVLDAIFWTCRPETIVQVWYECFSDSDLASRGTDLSKLIASLGILSTC
ncbi:hypothetical protein ACH5RR_032921 [Cinchona calisaya]|uniref:CID domain-containing protein n=1 Tax=Cinchona calisaya TaxID=153742 RepID=A0ABD2YJG3_9GENT